ncbi:RagB/SusD family nutrient uptake outer membrane protein [Pedobacter kyonggii]|uniref:RagB/SusD family nutrient uptake outer membrane protein n=1 Tax=Pedobacter kyonggii TaxID=1926871 RepID=A0A4Q9HFD5_9SPHI|nr:RagB/SusD family nutrient uptake outer membrane protein [Pedobacter kyonggii]TBO43605.1 RagB/SusD family nutrient uptake outer membrane protein [Pedobacter kyonggii]
MRTIKYIILSCLACLLFGCTKEFLDRKPIDFLAPDNFETENDIREAVNGIYRAYVSDKNEPIYTDFIVDNGYFPDYRDMWNRTYNNETSYIVNKWSRDYKVILRANTVLAYIDKVKLTESAYKQYKGEATFLRALSYADLSFFFGGVPMRLKPEGLEDANKALSSKAEIIELVLKDLEDAAALLPISYAASEKGRATKGAALAIKARVLLYNKRYEEAAAYCVKVKALNSYKIMPDYKTMFLPEGEAGNLETIFDMQYQTNALPQGLSNSWYDRFYLFSGYQVSHDLYEQYYSTNGLSITNPANKLYNPAVRTSDLVAPSTYVLNGGYDNRFQSRDPRMHFSIVVPYTIDSYNATTKAPGVFYPTDKKAANLTSFRVRKYVDYTNYNVSGISGVNPIIIRYADVLLMEAEALVEKGGYDEAYVYSLINQVRQRTSVMMPKVETAEGLGLSQQALRNVIRHERRVEFAFEGLRIFDIMRWENGPDAHKDLKGFNPAKLTRFASTGIVYEITTALQRTPFDAAKGYLWPIPKTETDANKLIK